VYLIEFQLCSGDGEALSTVYQHAEMYFQKEGSALDPPPSHLQIRVLLMSGRHVDLQTQPTQTVQDVLQDSLARVEPRLNVNPFAGVQLCLGPRALKPDETVAELAEDLRGGGSVLTLVVLDPSVSKVLANVLEEEADTLVEQSPYLLEVEKQQGWLLELEDLQEKHQPQLERLLGAMKDIQGALEHVRKHGPFWRTALDAVHELALDFREFFQEGCTSQDVDAHSYSRLSRFFEVSEALRVALEGVLGPRAGA